MMAKKYLCVNLIVLFYFAGKLEYYVGAKTGIPSLSDIINYGPYYIITRSIDTCTLPGLKDAENLIKPSLKVSKIDRIQEVFNGNIIIPHDLTNVSISISNEVWRDGGFKPFFYEMYRKPCKEKSVMFFLKNFFYGEKTCSVKRGNYSIENVSPTETLKNILGPSFFYERLSLTIGAHTRKGYIACMRFLCESKPILKKRQRTRYNNKTVSHNYTTAGWSSMTK